MRRILLLALLVGISSPVFARDTYVKPYVKSDGTYVEGHHRSSPNSKLYDNYNSSGGTNPYTGERGSERNEFSSPPAPQPGLYDPDWYKR